MSYKRVLIVTDDSPSALKAAKCGYELAKQLGAKVALMGVVDQALAQGNVDAGLFPEKAAQDLKKAMEEYLHRVKDDYGQGTDTEIFAPEGDVKQMVIQMCREWKADMIIAGTHGRKGLNRLLMGSMAEGILREAKVPVFIVPIAKR
jgi:nucleotide-binding universal stress UspA family protein